MAGGEHERGNAGDIDRFGRRAVGKLCQRKLGEDVVARIAPPFFDVLDEPLLFHAHEAATVAVKPAGYRGMAESLPVSVGYVQQVGDRVEREREIVVNDDLALALRDEAVELLVGKAPQEVLVVLELLRREQPAQQRAMRGVLRRIKGDEVIAERHPLAVPLDQIRDVIAAGFAGIPDHGPLTILHTDRAWSVSRCTARASSYPETITTPWAGSRHTGQRRIAS